MTSITNGNVRRNSFEGYERREVTTYKYEGDIIDLKVGESLKGVFIEKLTNVGKYKQNMYIFDTGRDDGKFDKIFGRTKLDTLMKDVKPGEPVEIIFTGLRYGENGVYKNFEVYRLMKKIPRL